MSKWHDLTTAEGRSGLQREMLVHVYLFGAVNTEVLWDRRPLANGMIAVVVKGERVVATPEQAEAVAKVLADIGVCPRAQREGAK